MKTTSPNAGFLKLFQSFFKNYFDFKGNINRRDFWLTFLIQLISTILIWIALIAIGFAIKEVILLFAICILYLIFLVVPLISITARRLNDSGRNPFFVLLPWGLMIVGVIIHICNLDDGNSWNPAREATYRGWGTVLLIIGFVFFVVLCCANTKTYQDSMQYQNNNQIDITGQLLKLKKLVDLGILTQEEFDKQKQQILKNT